MTVNYYQNFVDEITYESLNEWQVPNLDKFSVNKDLFPYQIEAVKNTAKILKQYYSYDDGKKELYDSCVAYNKDVDFSVPKYLRPIDERKGITSSRYELLTEYYNVNSENNTIESKNFMNRCAYWMATGSGKSLVLIKVIEYISYLKDNNLIPEYDLLLLVPKTSLFEQLQELVKEYNISKDLKSTIELVNLKDYDRDKSTPSLTKTIKVYYYRSDLIRDESKETILDYKDYENNGKWYVLLDEAHRGETGSSNVQDYISILSRNGFLFNFSATFTDEIDYATTVYNFNLEKFINKGYGKNIYLSRSNINFDSSLDEFSLRMKQLQVLKSVLTLTLVKKQTVSSLYHQPIMVTLVNSINTEDSDLLMFFKVIETIANNNFDESLFQQAKDDLMSDFNHKEYVYGDEKLQLDRSELINLDITDVLKALFNSETHGKIEMIEGEKNKEIVLKLQTASKPFALIKIGNADKFQRNQLGSGYLKNVTYRSINYFDSINTNADINILIGSRSFYEGWDSNRPNVINFINIGGADAQKYVLQALGRGIRIEPEKGLRKRLTSSDSRKIPLLETLFVFATNKEGIKSILKTIDHETNSNGQNISLKKANHQFDLLVPKYKATSNRVDFSYFYVSRDTKDRFKSYFNTLPVNLVILKYGININQYNLLKEKIDSEDLFAIKEEKIYYNMDFLFKLIIKHMDTKKYILNDIQLIRDEIIHFQHIRAIDLTDIEFNDLDSKIKNIGRYKGETLIELARMLVEETITEEEYTKRSAATHKKATFKDVTISHIAEHYYMPIIYAHDEKLSYLKNIIKNKSESRFVQSLIAGITSISNEVEWMFSKIQENVDSIYIPYYSRKDNSYRKFFPDFIFWIKKGDSYKIVFVDPKGTKHSDYLNKVDEFEKIFMDGNKPRIFRYDDYEISIDLKLVGEDINQVPQKYRSYWLTQGDYSFIDI